MGCFGQEIGQGTGIDLLLPLGGRRQQRLAPPIEAAVEAGDERQRFRIQDLIGS